MRLSEALTFSLAGEHAKLSQGCSTDVVEMWVAADGAAVRCPQTWPQVAISQLTDDAEVEVNAEVLELRGFTSSSSEGGWFFHEPIASPLPHPSLLPDVLLLDMNESTNTERIVVVAVEEQQQLRRYRQAGAELYAALLSADVANHGKEMAAMVVMPTDIIGHDDDSINVEVPSIAARLHTFGLGIAGIQTNISRKVSLPQWVEMYVCPVVRAGMACRRAATEAVMEREDVEAAENGSAPGESSDARMDVAMTEEQAQHVDLLQQQLLPWALASPRVDVTNDEGSPPLIQLASSPWMAAIVPPTHIRSSFSRLTGSDLPSIIVALHNPKGAIIYRYDDEAIDVMCRAVRHLHAHIGLYDAYQCEGVVQMLQNRSLNAAVVESVRHASHVLTATLHHQYRREAAEVEATANASTTQDEPLIYDPVEVLRMQRFTSPRRFMTALRREGSSAITVDALPPSFLDHLLAGVGEDGVDFLERLVAQLLSAWKKALSREERWSRLRNA